MSGGSGIVEVGNCAYAIDDTIKNSAANNFFI
jgi:hypothetical protein